MRILSWIVVCLFFYTIPVSTQDIPVIENDISNIKFSHLGIEDGLANSTIRSIIQDRQGFIWIAALNALCRYDGYEIKTYQHSPKNPNSLSGDRITALAEMQDGKFLVGNWQKGLDIFDPITGFVTHYRHEADNPASIGSNQISAIYIDKDQQIWIGAGNTLNQFNPVSGHFTVWPLENKNLVINSIVEFNNELWICTNQLRFFKFDASEKKFLPIEIIPPGHQDPLIWRCKLYADAKDNLWFCTVENGLYRYDAKTQQLDNYRHNPSDPNTISNNDVYDIVEDGTGNYWIATDGGGLNYFDFQGKKFIKILHNPANVSSPFNNKPHCFLKDNTNILWIGLYNGGVNIYKPDQDKFQSFVSNPNDPASLNNSIVWSFLHNKDNDILIGTDRGGINLYNPKKYGNKFVHIKRNGDIPGKIPSNSCITLFQDSNDIIWIGTYNNGLIRYDKQENTFTSIKAKEGVTDHPDYPAGNDVWDIAEDRNGHLWIATLRYGVDVYDPKLKMFEHYNTGNSRLSSNEVTTVFRDSKDRMWVGTANGLCLYVDDEKDFSVHKHVKSGEKGLFGDNVRTIFEDKKHVLWIGTEGAGLYKMKLDNFSCKNFSEEDGLPSNVVYGILEDDHGNLWISTSRGLSKFNTKQELFYNFTREEGLQSNEFKQNACLKLSDGRMLFGGIGGFSIFHPDSIKYNSHIPPVVITDFYALGKSSGEKGRKEMEPIRFIGNKEIKIHPKNVILIFKYAALNYTIPQKNQYAYMLEGFDDDWHYVQNRREATYTNLNPGKYIFRVKGSNNDGVWNETGISVQFEVLPPWHKTLVFRISIILLLIGVGILINYIRIRRLKRQKQKLELEVNLRTQDLQRANFELQQKQDEITTQNEEISQQNEEILAQRDEIEKKSRQLEKSYNRIKAFNELGQELTTLLDITAINEMIYNYVSSLVDASVFGIGIYVKERNHIHFHYFKEKNKFLPPFASSMDDTTSNAVWCFKNQTHILCNDFENEYKNFISNIRIKTSKVPGSLIYLPLTVQNKKIGILTVQSFKKHAYTDNDLQTLHTMASYFAIALDNANAYDIVKMQNIELEKHRAELESLVKERTKDLEKAKLKAEESDRLKSAFLANMSHEIRTPLNAIVGFAEILASENFEVVSKNEIIRIIEHNSSSLVNVINDIIDFSKIEAGEINLNLKDVHPSSLLQEVYYIFAETLKKSGRDKDINLILKPNEALNVPVLHTDPIRLRQILCNLLDNAIKYTEKGQVEFGYKQIDEKNISFYVKDTGIGIKPENFEIIFERFSKIEGENILFRGTGLGLTITKYLVGCLGGKIWLTSIYGEGTEFMFSLPVKTRKMVKISDQIKPESRPIMPDWKDKKVLIAEDEVSNYRLLVSYLKNTKIEVLWAKNGIEAVEQYSINPSIDLILMDIKMPRKDGITAAEEIKGKDPNVPIIAQTAYALPEEEHRIRSSYFDEYMAKPIIQGNLIAMMSKFLDA